MYSIYDNKDENFDIAFFRNVWNFNCKVCGFNNKLFRVIIDRNKKIIGYSLTCCQCGNVHEFHINIEDNGIYNVLTSMLYYNKGLDVCMQPTTCNHKKCPLWGTCNPDCSKKIKYIQHGSNIDNNIVDIQVLKEPKYL
jgi:hypothetical protein